MGQAWDSGGAGIRTQETLARPTVFKTAPFDRSGTPPSGSVYGGATPRGRRRRSPAAAPTPAGRRPGWRRAASSGEARSGDRTPRARARTAARSVSRTSRRPSKCGVSSIASRAAVSSARDSLIRTSPSHRMAQSVPRWGDATTPSFEGAHHAVRRRSGLCGSGSRRVLRPVNVRDPALARPADSVQQLSAGRRGCQVDRNEAVGETLGDPGLELEVTEPVRSHRRAEEIPQLLASLEVRGHLDRLAKREELSARPLDADRCRRPHIHGIAAPALRRSGAWYGVQLATRSGAPSGRSTSGTSPWKFSRIARAIRSTTAVPFSVWTGSGPCSPRKRICRRRAWKSVVFEIDAVSR